MCVCVWVTDKAQGNSSIHAITFTVVCSLLAGLLFFMLRIFQGRASLAKPANGAIKWGHGNDDLNCHLFKSPNFMNSYLR